MADPTGQRAGGGQVDINSASQQDLAKVPGIGDERARKLIEFRNQNGPFKSIDDIDRVPGFGGKLNDEARRVLTVSGQHGGGGRNVGGQQKR